MNRKLTACLSPLLLANCFYVSAMQQVEAQQTPFTVESAEAKPPAFEKTRLSIRSAGQDYVFAVEIAETPRQQEYGLMFRTRLLADHGMLFILPADDVLDMWMKNTLIPLDMLFIDKHGSIVAITEDAAPNSLDVRSAHRPVRAALEIAGGTCKRLHIQIGDTVEYRSFAP